MVPRYSVGRRQLLAALGVGAVGGTAGCSTIANWIAGLALDDVNVFNETDQRVAGSIEIVTMDDTTRLSESFDLAPGDDDEDDETSSVAYGDVWDDSGDYTVTVTLDREIRGESAAMETITIADPADEMLGVPLGAPDVDAGIGIRVAEEWTGFTD